MLKGHRNALVVLVSVWMLACVGVVAPGVAWAAPPEQPQAEVLSHTSTSVELRGILSPNAAGQEGTYEFLYAQSATTCTGGSKGRRGLLFGFQHEEVYEEISGLAPHTTYTVCLLARNLAGEEAESAPVTFTTSFEPEAETGAATGVEAASAELHGVLNMGKATEAGSYEFAYRKAASECRLENPQTHQFENEFASSAAPSTGEASEQVHASVGGLTPDTEYTYCLVAHNATGQTAVGAPHTFTTLTRRPTISGERIAKIGVSSTTVSAEIEPGGLATGYVVEYGTTASYGSETTVAYISGQPRRVTVALPGLQPNLEYHFRFVATNEDGQEQAPDMAFTTYTPRSGLPDGRSYEMVTPPENRNADVYELGDNYYDTEFPGFMASDDGNAVAYVAQSSTGGNGSSGNGLGNQYVATRGPGTGWSQQNVTPPASNLSTQYQGFSSDLSRGYVAALTVPPVVPTEAPALPNSISEQEEAFDVLYSRSFDENSFQPLQTTQRRRPTQGGEHGFGSWVGATLGYGDGARPVYAGSSQDGSDVLFEMNEALLSGTGAL